MAIHWGRIVLAALLLEIALGVVLIPISFVSEIAFFIAVPIGTFVFGYLITRWMLRKVPSRLLLHGTLIGIVATVMYFGLVLMAPGGLAAAVETYGAPLFYFSNVMRVAGCAAAGAHQQRRRCAVVRHS